MITVLSIENMMGWSWGLAVKCLAESLRNKYQFIRMSGRVGSWTTELCKNCGKPVSVAIPAVKVSDDVVNFFDLTLVQNIDSFSLVNNKKVLVGRLGGMRTFDNAEAHKFDRDLENAAAVIATNDQLFEIASPMNGNAFMIPNGVDLETFKPRSQRQTVFDDGGKTFTVGFAGNICGEYAMYYKGWKYYVQATLRLRPKIETLNFLYGHNQIPHDEMPEKFYHKIDCLVLPSINEGCSNVIVEALACGVPVLTTKVGFHGGRLEGGVNCLFIKRNIDDITAKIQLLMRDHGLRMKLAFNGRLFAENNHNINILANEYHKVFQLVLHNKNKKADRKE